MSDLESLTLLELKKLAKENNIRNISKLKKEELIEVLKSIQSNKFEEVDEEIEEDDEDAEVEEPEEPRRRYDASDDEVEKLEEANAVAYQVNNEEDEIIEGILEVLPDGYGFLRGDNYLSIPKDLYISPIQIIRFRLTTGDLVKGISRCKEGEKFPSLIFVGEVNGPKKQLVE